MLVSIIIPFYNVEYRLIERCVKSVLGIENTQVIIVDDGSDVSYAKHIEKIEQLSDEIVVLRKDNGGVSSARNYGVQHAAGEYVVFLDADDYYVEGAIVKSKRLLDKYKPDIMMAGLNYSSVSEYDQKYHIMPDEKGVTECSANEIQGIRTCMIRSRIEFDEGSIGRGPVAKFVRTTIAKQCLFDEKQSVGEDIIWTLDILQKGEKIVLIKEVWYIYYDNYLSVTRSYNRKICDALELHLDVLKNYIDFADLNQYAAYRDRIIELIRMFWRCCLGHNKADLSYEEKKMLMNRIYFNEPWIKIKEEKYFKCATLSRKAVILLYRFKLLFAVLKIIRYKG